MDMVQEILTSGLEIPRSIIDYRTIIPTGMEPKEPMREMKTRITTMGLVENLFWEIMEIVAHHGEIWTGFQKDAICREATILETLIDGWIDNSKIGIWRENSNGTAGQEGGLTNNQVQIGPWTEDRGEIMTQEDLGSNDDMTSTGSRSTSGRSNSVGIRRSCP